MKSGKFLIPFFLSVLLLGFMSCKKGKEHITESGLKYRLYTNSSGKRAKAGDYVTIEMVYKTAGDSILFDSRLNESPMRFKLEDIPFPGSYEEGLTYLSEGDSATFYVSSDSLYALYAKTARNPVRQSETVFNAGSYMLFDVKLLRVQDYIEAEQEQLMHMSDIEKTERDVLRKFLWDKDFFNSPDSGIYYVKMIKEGSGSPVDTGKFVSVKYTAKFPDGRVFDYAGAPGKPFTFVSGAGEVIQGLDLALLQLREGDRAEILIPSRYAYGEEGLKDLKSGAEIIAPYSTLWYDIEVLSVVDTLKLVKK